MSSSNEVQWSVEASPSVHVLSEKGKKNAVIHFHKCTFDKANANGSHAN